MDKIVLQAADLDGYLTRADQEAIARWEISTAGLWKISSSWTAAMIRERARRRGTAAVHVQ